VAANMNNLLRRLDRLEAQVGDEDGDDFGPTLVIRLTRYWRSGLRGADGSGDVDRLGALREQHLIDATVAEVRAEARARRERVEHIMVGCDRDGTVRVDGVPWRTPTDQPLAWVPRSVGK
jgi:hypothetical protein